jgi:hypothetical protein
MPYFYSKFTQKINDLTHAAFGSQAQKLNFSARFFCILLVPFLVSVVLMIDRTVINIAPITEGLNGILNTTISSTALFWGIFGIFISTGLILAGYCLKVMNGMKEQLLRLAKYYGFDKSDVDFDNPDVDSDSLDVDFDNPHARPNIVKWYEQDSAFTSIMSNKSRERINFVAFEVLRREHKKSYLSGK